MQKRRRRGRKSKRNRQKRIIHILLILVFIFLFIDGIIIGSWLFKTHRQSRQQAFSNDLSEDESTIPVSQPITKPVEEEPAKEVKLMAVGDNLIHTAVWQAGLQSDGSHDYTTLYTNISKYLEESDIKIMNQETIFAGDEKGFQDYPSFNSPEAIGHALVSVGFNVIQHASNHSLDMGQSGLLHCVDFWKTEHPEITVLGIYETAEEQEKIPILEMNGITFALLNYTYSHNAETFSTYADGYLNMLCAYDENTRVIDFDTIHPKVLEDIEKAEFLADFTIVLPHWGVEYTMTPTDQEVNFAHQMTKAGADLIIGTHPHVIQPVEWITADNGNKALCYYSLGNYTSAQNGVAQMLGGMANLTIIQDENGTYIDEESIKAIPLVTHFVYPGWTGSTVVDSTYLLKDYTDEQAAEHGLKNAWGITLTREELLSLAENTFGEYLTME